MSKQGRVGRPVVVAVCRKCKRHGCLVDFLDQRPQARVHLVGCQKLCHGPVAGMEVDGRMEWFERMDGPKAMVALARLAEGRRSRALARPLAKRRSHKHAGRPPR